MSGPSSDRWSQSVMDCSAQLCSGHGDCVSVNGSPVCKCLLGYMGDNCDKTVNGGLSVPLTLGCLGVLFGLIILAFLFAYFRQKAKAKMRKQIDNAKDSLKKNGDFISYPHGETGHENPQV